jgi:predicted ATP-grasp superfamily ATP-dependent carboligase
LGVRVSFHDLPPLGTTVPAGAPALSVIVRGPQDTTILRRAAQRIAADLRRDLRAP